ncbi:MAG: ribonuclease III [Alphaproteobacteria bacterium]|nr:ribonuclease III [Alphaproteobacteria bacterium]
MTPKERAGLKSLEAALGHHFSQPQLLAEALTHPSAAHQGAAARRGYERLEFLGDRVLGLIVAELLWHRFPQDDEGVLTRRQVALVRRETLAIVAREISLGGFLVVSSGEDAAGVRMNTSVLADVCEAVIAALYLDGGLAAAQSFVERHWVRHIGATRPPRDPKTALQEWAQACGLSLPRYTVLETTGPPHRRRFTVTVLVDGVQPETASGGSKREAEAAAAAALLTALGETA